MAKVELKQPIVDEIANSIKDAQAVVLVNYSGLTVEQDTILRKELREAGVQYKVYKNTMMKRAFAGTDCEELSQHLEGTNAIAISTTDATAPARILAKYAKQFPALELIAGVVVEHTMIRLESRLCLRFRPEKNFLENFLEASSLLLPTLLVCLIRSLRKTVVLTQQQLNNPEITGQKITNNKIYYMEGI